jgi:hypothetical protein
VKVLKQHGMDVEASAEFCDGCAWENHIDKVLELGQLDPMQLENRLTQMCVWTSDRNVSRWCLLLRSLANLGVSVVVRTVTRPKNNRMECISFYCCLVLCGAGEFHCALAGVVSSEFW